MTTFPIMLRNWLPPFVRQRVIVYRRQWRFFWKWLMIYMGGKPTKKKIYVSYGHEHIPKSDEQVRGGIVKFQRIQPLFPSSSRRFNTLYLGSSSLPADWMQQVWLAKRKEARIVLNQNGVGYPGWHGPGWEKFNQPMIKLAQVADHVFYQSNFCKLAADRFLGKRLGPWEVLYNAVDTQFFTPTMSNPDLKQLIILLGGNQYQFYRLESALQTIALVRHQRPNAQLVVTGRLNWMPDENQARSIALRTIHRLNLDGHVEFIGPYAQQEAPAIYQQAHILLHTKYNDPCSSTVIEAMACGLPVAYSHSGGTPELVGADAGIGAVSELNWERDIAPDPQMLADAILRIAEKRMQYAEAARQRAVEHFDLQPWLHRHQEVFESLLQHN